MVAGLFPSGLLLAGDTNSLYFDLDAGANFQQDTYTKYRAPAYIGIRPTGMARFSPGEALDLKAGYKLNPWLAVELAAGFMQNDIYSIGRFSVHGVDFTQFPLMANFVLSRELSKNWSVYAGGGAGFIVSQWDCGIQIFEKRHIGVPTIAYHPAHIATANDLVPAYEAMAGIKYAISKSWSLKLGYQFMATTEGHNWTIAAVDVQTNPTMSHSLTLALSYSF